MARFTGGHKVSREKHVKVSALLLLSDSVKGE